MSTPAPDLGDTSYRETSYQDAGLGRTPLRSARLAAREAETVPSLLRRLADEVTTLFAQELALLKSETTSSVNDMKTGLVSVAAGGLVTLLGAIFLLLAAVYGLSEVVQPWLAALIVGGAVTLIGLIMLMTGKKKVDPAALRPRHTESALRKDANMIKGEMQHGQPQH